MESFKVPAKPWGTREVAYLSAHQHLLDNATRAELGLAPVEDAPESVEVEETVTPSEEVVPEPTTEEVVEETPEVPETPETPEVPEEVETPEAEVTTDETPAVDNGDAK